MTAKNKSELSEMDRLMIHNFLIGNIRFSNYVWIISIVLTSMAFIEIALTDLNIIMPDYFYNFTASSLGLGSGMIISRLIYGLYLVIINWRKKR